MCKFKCGKNCPHCEWYEPGGYFYESDCEGYRDEGCNIDQSPETCTKYEPTYIQSLLDEIEELKAELENFKKVDEEELKKLAESHCENYDFEPTQRNSTDSGWEYGHTYTQLVECFKAGYRKAKGE